jgi:hypothetical protein
LHYGSAAVSSVLTPVDPNERIRRRRKIAQRKRRLRRAAAGLILVGLAAGFAYSARNLAHHSSPSAAPAKAAKRTTATHILPTQPHEIRGIHITMSLANVPGRYRQYLRLPALNTIELDVKDEDGHVAFPVGSVPLAQKVHASSLYFRPALVAREAHAAGLYLIGRVVTFEDPILSAARPQLALHNPDGSLWHTNGGLGWLNPYDKRAWNYDVSIAEAAARAGFDEIQFDYVRFPSDGDVSKIKYPVRVHEPMANTIARFVQYAAARLHPLGARVSVDVFGLAATRDLGIGQRPSKLAKTVDAVYPMVYPSHFGAGEYGLADPNANPGQTVTDALLYFLAQMRGSKARLVPWLQDFSLGRTYRYADVVAQIDAVRALGLNSFMLWNPLGEYTVPALARP